MHRDRSSCVVILALLFVAACLAAPAGAQKENQPSSYRIVLPPKPDFSGISWIIGDWAGHTTNPRTDKETEGTIHLSVSYVLDRRFVRLSEDIMLPAGSSAPATHETWVGFLNADPAGSGFKLRAFSSTGFITEYDVSVSGNQIRFDPEGGANPPPGWLFRRVISRLSSGYFGETVDVAPPGGSFFPYYASKLTQVLESKPSTPVPSSPVPPSSAPATSGPPSPDASKP